ncbi:uncharacterized protein LOC143918185 isoform X2 [Arctopsyche grandis]|uniref:uncharacterized protein LOC143918185 isoform X2 n=1 Tax=Arctopsyche grandis TaxID=121162 RepID=UPI00406D7202
MIFKSFYCIILLCSFYIMTVCCEKCDSTPCLSENLKQSITRLWTVPNHMNCLLKEFKDKIISLLDVVDDNQFSVLVPMSLWSVDILTGFNPEVSPTCVFGNLIDGAISANDRKTSGHMHENIKKFGELCQKAIFNSIDIGLQAAGCPERKTHKNTCPKSCPVETKAVDRILEIEKDNIPAGLHCLIKRLVSSKNTDEKVIGLAAVASLTKPSIDFFSKIDDDSSFLKMIQLKGCNIKISKESCLRREKQLKQYANDLSAATSNVINNLTKHVLNKLADS